MVDGELEFVKWLRGRQRPAPGVPLGIGDDMAVVDGPSGRVLLSSDMLLDGVHFDTSRHDLELIGRKAVACSVSDCAAMAVCPVAVTVSLALPKEWSLDRAQRLSEGIFAAADEFKVAVVGGDTTRWDRTLVLDVAIMGQCFEGIEPVPRSGASVGDRICVTGPLGGSSLGRHFTFTPRVNEARALAGCLAERLHAMIDISDGLLLDLWRICEASEVGALLEEARLETLIGDDAKRAAEIDGRSAMEHVLSDGEDFELLLAASGALSGSGVPLLPIGEVTAKGAGLGLRRRDGGIEPLEPKGYVH